MPPLIYRNKWLCDLALMLRERGDLRPEYIQRLSQELQRADQALLDTVTLTQEIETLKATIRDLEGREQTVGKGKGK